MLSTRLVHLIESHADQLTRALVRQLKTDPRTTAFRALPDEEIQHIAFKIYRNLGEVLEGRAKEDTAQHFEQVGHRRYHDGVPIAQMMWAIVLNKKTALAYLRNNAWGGTPLEVFSEEELVNRVDQFYDEAMYYTALGFEKAAAEHSTEHHFVVHHG